jgi:hypothetical protein
MEAQLRDEPLSGSIAEMRDLAEHRDWHNHTGKSNRERVSDLADRLDRARMKMEIEIANLRKENAKLREAIVTIQNCDINKEEDCYTLYRVCDAALATPRHLEAASLQDAPAN